MDNTSCDIRMVCGTASGPISSWRLRTCDVGKEPQVSLGSTLNESTLAIWALSLSIFGQIKSELEAMQACEVQNGVTRLKEENHPRIKEDTANRLKILEIFSTCIDVFDDTSHSSSSLVNIFYRESCRR